MLSTLGFLARSSSLAAIFASLLVGGAIVPTATAADSDLSTNLTGPASTALAQAPLITVGYGNTGPDTAASAYINAYVPGGLPVPISQLSQGVFDTLQGTAATFDTFGRPLTTTDTLGNIPYLYIEDAYCEHLLFQLAGPAPIAGSVQGLTPGVSASFTFNPQIPMDAPPEIGKITIYDPPSLAATFRPALIGTNFLQAADSDLYSRGGDCDSVPNNLCADLTACFGSRVSEYSLIDGELELVDDGTANPTLGCDPLVGFTPGKIALIERGVCEFGQKVFNAELAGAAAVFMVNDGRCGEFPDSDLCVFNMSGGSLGPLVTIPLVQVSVVDGQPILDAVTMGTPVRMLYGPQGDSFYISGGAFLLDVLDTDPNDSNNESLLSVPILDLDCSATILPTDRHFPASGGADIIDVTIPANCPWEAYTAAPWITVPPGQGGPGVGAVNYTVEVNVGQGRAATVAAASQVHIVTQASGNGCTYSVSPSAAAVAPWGGSVTFTVTTQPSCDWSVAATHGWITVEAPAAGSSSGTVTYEVGENLGESRSGAVMVADQIHTVTQDSLAPLLIFRDGFESGNAGGWSVFIP